MSPDVLILAGIVVLVALMVWLRKKRLSRGNSQLEALHTHPANFKKQSVEWVRPQEEKED